MINSKNKKVIVAMSGGVDSSVAAALLKKAGFDVVGVFMRFWYEPSVGNWNRHCSSDVEKRAKMVAVKLKIPFFILDFRKEFKKKVVDYFLKECKAGLTPNPCITCNKEIKFGLLFKKAVSLKADYIATGHYVKISRINSGFKIFRAKDRQKDQSYFLWALNQRQFKKALFPLGNFTKKEVRNLAKKFRLPVLGIPESQEICFIQTNINNFLKRKLRQKIGKIVDTAGEIIGQHQGLAFYTIGQRKGIRLPGGPYYVLGKDLKKNFLVVTKNEKDLVSKELVADNVNWISGQEPKLPIEAQVKIRYLTNPSLAIVSKVKNNGYKLRFKKSQRAITPGQSVVFYRGGEMLGGGIIKA
jgi:tRNA-specific 2-thiouridylase